METINHEYYVSLEVAQLLKKAGFDWKCYKVYKTDVTENLTLFTYTKEEGYRNTSEFICSAPTLEVAQRWLRENWNLIITIEYNYHKNVFTCKVYSKSECLSILFDFSVYEEAQEAGIKKALEIILEKEE